MKKIIGCIILITLSQLNIAEDGDNIAYIDQNQNKIVDFDDREYKLAWESSRNSTFAKEFVTGNETLSNWTTLISIRKFMTLSINQAIPLYLKKIGTYLSAKPKFLKNEKILGNHVFIEMYLKSEIEEYKEYNLVLFIEKYDGVYMYQYSEKILKSQEEGADEQYQGLDVIMEAMTSLL